MAIRRARILASTSAALLAGALIAAGPAAADTPSCVSDREYDRVDVGMKMSRAHKIFDIKGERLGIDGDQQVRGYRACGDPAGVRNIGLELRREDGVWRVGQKYRVAE